MTNMPDTNKLCNPWAAFTNEIRIYTPKITNPICIIPAIGAKINNIITTIVWKITCNTCVQAIIDKISPKVALPPNQVPPLEIKNAAR